MTFSDLASVIEWNESYIKPAMPLISPNFLLHPTAKQTPSKLEHLVIAKMTGSWDKNHCLRWKTELLRLVFIKSFSLAPSRDATHGRHYRGNEIAVSENKDILLVNKWRDAACSIQRNKQKCVENANEKLLSKCSKYFVSKETTSTATTKTTTTAIPQESLKILLIKYES